MRKALSFLLAFIMLFSFSEISAFYAYSASKTYAEDKLVDIQKQSGYIPGKTSAVQNNCYGFIAKVCEKLYGVSYNGEGLYDNYKARHQTGNYYTVATYTTKHTTPTSDDVNDIISFFIKNAVPGDIVHYGANSASSSNTHTFIIQSINSTKMSIYHSNYQIAQYGRSTCHIDDIYWDSFKKSPTKHVKNADGTLYSLNAAFYNKMKQYGLGISINRYSKYENKFYLVSAATPQVKTSRSSSTGIKVSWDKIANASKYKVQYKKSEDSSYKTATSSCKSTSYTISGLTTGEKYSFRVAAYIGSKFMDYSSAVSKQVLPPTIADVKFSLESNGINVKWAKRTDITGVRIYRSETKSGTYSKIKTITDNKVAAYLDKDIKYGNTYYYKLERYVKSGSKTYSTTSEIKTASYSLSKPTVSFVNNNAKSITFKLAAKGCCDSFVYYITDSDDKNVVPLTPTEENTITVDNLNVGKKYHFKCAQKTALGTGEYTVLTVQALPNKQNITSAKKTVSGNKISYTKSSDVSGYCVYRSTSKNGSFKLIATVNNVNTISYIDSSIKYNTEYYYKVRSFIKTGKNTYYGAYSNLSASVKNKVGKPSGLTVTRKSPTSVTLKWKAADNANKYIVEYKIKGGKWTSLSSNSKTGKTISKLSRGKTYYFRVKAGNKIGWGSFCANVSKKILPPTPSAPKLTLKSNGIKVRWNIKDYASGYEIYRASSKNGKYTLVKTIKNPADSSWTDKSVKKNKKYYYKTVCFVKKGKTTYKSPKSPYECVKYM